MWGGGGGGEILETLEQKSLKRLVLGALNYSHLYIDYAPLRFLTSLEQENGGLQYL